MSSQAIMQTARLPLRHPVRHVRGLYANDAEYLERYGLFKKSKARFAKLHALNPEPVFGITSMSDRHPEESGNVAR